ncbi:type II secretion system GspH family protein [Patescibacteria group bacterium]|nr:type II secretion system GspH family protein [Patescibacteria group bacterium]
MKDKATPAGRQGFTLIELLVVMTIIAILIGLSLVSYQSARKSARDGKRKSDLEQIRSALEMYRSDSDTSAYPDALADLGDYIILPADPLSTSNYAYSSSDSNYALCASLELGGSTADPSCSGLSCGGICNYYTTSP